MYYDFKPELISHCMGIIQIVYEKYNGVINPINRSAELIVLPQSADKFGYIAYMNKRVVYIYMQNLLMNYEEGLYLDFQCVFTTLHELSHFDQSIDLDQYRNDMEYNNFIESANDANTARFILDHIEEINELLSKSSADYDLQRFDMGMLRQDFAPYIRTTISEVYISTIDKYFLRNPQDDERIFKIYDLLHRNPDYIENILISIKSGQYTLEEFPIRYKHMWCDNTGELNRIIFRYLVRYDEISYSTTIKYDRDLRTIIFEANISEISINPFKPF